MGCPNKVPFDKSPILLQKEMRVQFQNSVTDDTPMVKSGMKSFYKSNCS